MGPTSTQQYKGILTIQGFCCCRLSFGIFNTFLKETTGIPRRPKRTRIIHGHWHTLSINSEKAGSDSSVLRLHVSHRLQPVRPRSQRCVDVCPAPVVLVEETYCIDDCGLRGRAVGRSGGRPGGRGGAEGGVPTGATVSVGRATSASAESSIGRPAFKAALLG